MIKCANNTQIWYEFNAIFFPQLRQSIDALLNQMKELPARLRAYSSFEYVKKQLQQYAKVNFTRLVLFFDSLEETFLQHIEPTKSKVQTNHNILFQFIELHFWFNSFTDYPTLEKL